MCIEETQGVLLFIKPHTLTQVQRLWGVKTMLNVTNKWLYHSPFAHRPFRPHPSSSLIFLSSIFFSFNSAFHASSPLYWVLPPMFFSACHLLDKAGSCGVLQLTPGDIGRAACRRLSVQRESGPSDCKNTTAVERSWGSAQQHLFLLALEKTHQQASVSVLFPVTHE